MAIYSSSNEFQSAVEQYNNLGNQSTTAALEQCMLLSRINDKILEESGGNVNDRSYKKTVKKLRQMCTNLKKVQFCKDVAVGRYLIENQERDVGLSAMSKTAIYKKFIYVPKPKTEHMPRHMLDQPKHESVLTEHMPRHMLDQPKHESVLTEHMPRHMLDQPKHESVLTEHMPRHMLDQPKHESVLLEKEKIKKLQDIVDQIGSWIDGKTKPGMFQRCLRDIGISEDDLCTLQ
jgi:hypothetical protein